ncbi:MAG TPA: DUF4388 domain-containing protein [Vicinamibacteria bacterium]|jgi:hypothetical protein
MTFALKPQGSLAVHDVPDLVQALHEGRCTGVLTLTHMGIGRSITVQEGRLVFASSTSPDDRLGELLMRRGRLGLRELVDAGKAIGPGKRLGTVLVEQGVLEPKDLVRAVVEHTQEIIYGAFQWTEGQYRLQEGAPPAEAITLKISTPDIIMEGIRRIEAWTRIQRAVGGLETRYERAPDYESAAGTMNLSFEKLSLLTALNGTPTLEQICAESTLPDFEVCRVLWAYRVLGLVRALDAAPRAEAALDEGLGLVLPQD